MANLKKYTLKQMGRVAKEAYREIEKSGYKNYVDQSKFENNFSYNFESSKDMMREMRRRINEILDGQIIKDGTKVGSWIFTCPQELLGNPALERKYFDVSKSFCEERYGKENIIDAVIHRDETTPHMTVYVVPECTSRKTGRRTVSTASCFTRKDLQSFHPDFEKVLQKEFGMKGLGSNGKTKENKDITDLKYDTVQQLREENEILQKENAALQAANEALEAQVKDLQARVSEKPEKASETPQKPSESVKAEQKVERVPKVSESPQKPPKASLLFSFYRAEVKDDKEVMKHIRKMYHVYYPESDFESEYRQYQVDQKTRRDRHVTVRTDDRQDDYQLQ